MLIQASERKRGPVAVPSNDLQVLRESRRTLAGECGLDEIIQIRNEVQGLWHRVR